MPHVLIVDDDHTVAKTLERTLALEGYRVSVAHGGDDALALAQEAMPDLAVIDIVMPGMNGIELCQRLRASPGLSSMPILFLTAKREITDKALGFGAGADDYLTKPFDIRELVMRIRALLRRVSRLWEGPEPKEIKVGELCLDCRKFTLRTPDKVVLLTPIEFDLMLYMMRYAGEVFSPRRLLQAVWGYPSGAGSTDLVRVHVKNIREKIEADPSAPHYIRTVPRHGYTVGE
jgi:DNA-binding response OmpR family regulator